MSNKDNYLKLYETQWLQISEAPDEIRLKLYDAITKYAFYGELTDFNDWATKSIYTGIIRAIDRRNSAIESGKRGADNRWNNPNSYPNGDPNRVPNGGLSDISHGIIYNRKDISNKKEEKIDKLEDRNDIKEDINDNTSSSSPSNENNLPIRENIEGDNIYKAPTADEARQYATMKFAGKNFNYEKINWEEFVDYYEAADWKETNGNPINWKQKVVYWVNHHKEDKPVKTNKHTSVSQSGDIDRSGFKPM